jgi:6-pyruvoyltetrahydropterin/6-carboxytetrahydropterin synthase
MGHRLLNHEGKCAHLHGHNYVGLFTAAALDSKPGDLDPVGRVIDFAVLKAKIGGWIERRWDHGFVYSAHDKATDELMKAAAETLEQGQKFYIMDRNPTAENLADHLFFDICPILLAGTGVKVVEITLWETENCYATVKQ